MDLDSEKETSGLNGEEQYIASFPASPHSSPQIPEDPRRSDKGVINESTSRNGFLWSEAQTPVEDLEKSTDRLTDEISDTSAVALKEVINKHGKLIPRANLKGSVVNANFEDQGGSATPHNGSHMDFLDKLNLTDDHTQANVEHSVTDANDDASRDGSTASDNDPGERPVRKKLKQTTITGTSKAAEDNDASGPSDDQSSSSEENENGDIDRGRVIKKRSFDDLQADEVDATDSSTDDRDHRRKRSCDSEVGDDLGVRNSGDRTPNSQNEENAKQILSPKKKRSIDQLKIDDLKGEELSAKQGEEVLGGDISDDKSQNSGEPEKKRHRDNSQERVTDAQAKAVPSTASLPNPFSNTSTVSPFASLASPKPLDTSTEKKEFSKPAHITSASAFASSGLAAFAGSERSPFGALGSSTEASSVFKSPFNPASHTPSAPKFSAASGPSPFAATRTSGFTALGSGFGGSASSSGFCSTVKAGGGLTSFASPVGPSILGGLNEAKPPSGLGDDSGEDNENEESNPMEGFGKEKEDERFFEQEIETGEEDEMTYFTCKAKLFHFTGTEWKERGVGNFKVNVREPEDCEDGKKSARLIMRADGVLRVMLNTPIFKGMNVGDGSGNEPTTKQLHLASLENGRSVPLLLRTANDDLAKELYRVILDLQQQL